MDENLEWLTQKTEDPKSNKGNLTPKMLGKGYRNNAMKRKISEALYCRELKPALNVQEKSINLELFNELFLSRR